MRSPIQIYYALNRSTVGEVGLFTRCHHLNHLRTSSRHARKRYPKTLPLRSLISSRDSKRSWNPSSVEGRGSWLRTAAGQRTVRNAMAFVTLAAGGLFQRRAARSCSSNDGICEAVLPIAQGFAENMGVAVKSVRFEGRKLTILIEDGDRKPTLDDCQNMSTELDEVLQSDAGVDSLIGASNYSLVVSTPGVRQELCEDFEFDVFKGFPIVVTTSEPFKKKTEFKGTLQGRDEEFVMVNNKGKIMKIPRNIIASVSLAKAKEKD